MCTDCGRIVEKDVMLNCLSGCLRGKAAQMEIMPENKGQKSA